ncbi:hypothetical protein MEO41_28520, partial [Dolichospermum sp. ST_sed4]|nr:hypothetical protein [Dolichospermum sp. ST_sed4]
FVHGALKRGEEILEVAKKIVTMEKSRLTYWEYLVSFYKREYQNALILNTKKGEYWWWRYNQAVLLNLLNREKEAKIYFDSLRIECLEFFKNNPNVVGPGHRIYLALAYAGLGDKVKSLNVLDKLD